MPGATSFPLPPPEETEMGKDRNTHKAAVIRRRRQDEARKQKGLAADALERGYPQMAARHQANADKAVKDINGLNTP